HAWHLDVQRDDVRLQAEDAVARDVGIDRGPDHLDVGDLAELLRQHLPDDCRVVDDEDPDHGRDLPTCADACAPSTGRTPVSCSTAARSASTVNGFWRNAAPCARTAARRASRSSPDTTRIATSDVAGFARIARTSSSPLMPGMLR